MSIDTYAPGVCPEPECDFNLPKAMEQLITAGAYWDRSHHAMQSAETLEEIEEVLMWQAELNAHIQSIYSAIKLHSTLPS